MTAEQLQMSFAPASTIWQKTLICPYCGEDHGNKAEGFRKHLGCNTCKKMFIFWLIDGTYDSAMPMRLQCPHCGHAKHQDVNPDDKIAICSMCRKSFDVKEIIRREQIQ